MANNHANGQSETIELEEHRSVNGVNAKAVTPYGFDGTNLQPLKTDSSGRLTLDPTSVGSGGGGATLKPSTYDTKALTQTSTTDAWAYKLSGVLQATKTITYTDSTKSTISTIVWS